MKIIDLIENIRKEYIYILSERDKIRQLNSEVSVFFPIELFLLIALIFLILLILNY